MRRLVPLLALLLGCAPRTPSAPPPELVVDQKEITLPVGVFGFPMMQELSLTSHGEPLRDVELSMAMRDPETTLQAPALSIVSRPPLSGGPVLRFLPTHGNVGDDDAVRGDLVVRRGTQVAKVAVHGRAVTREDCEQRTVCRPSRFDETHGVCHLELLPEGSACQLDCIPSGTCRGLDCEGPIVPCDDGISCTRDFCDLRQGCGFEPNADRCQEPDDHCADLTCDSLRGCVESVVPEGELCTKHSPMRCTAGRCQAADGTGICPLPTGSLPQLPVLWSREPVGSGSIGFDESNTVFALRDTPTGCALVAIASDGTEQFSVPTLSTVAQCASGSVARLDAFVVVVPARLDTADGARMSERIEVRRASDGSLVWNKALHGELVPEASASERLSLAAEPALAQPGVGALLVHVPNDPSRNWLLRVALATGDVLQRQPLTGEFHAFASDGDGTLYFVTPSPPPEAAMQVFALAADGTLRWEQRVPVPERLPGLALDVVAERLVIDGATVLDASDGTLIATQSAYRSVASSGRFWSYTVSYGSTGYRLRVVDPEQGRTVASCRSIYDLGGGLWGASDAAYIVSQGAIGVVDEQARMTWRGQLPTVSWTDGNREVFDTYEVRAALPLHRLLVTRLRKAGAEARTAQPQALELLAVPTSAP